MINTVTIKYSVSAHYHNMAKLLVLTVVALACAKAEPPVSREYLPANQGGYASQPSSQYGVPEPSVRLGGSSRFGGAGSLSTKYGAPVASSRFGNGASIRSGGSTSPSNRYGAPSASSRFGGTNSLANQYDTTRLSSRFGNANSLSTQYGAPGFSGRLGATSSLSSQFGASGSSSRLGGTGSLSTQYGAPSAFSRFNAPTSQYAPGGGYAASRARYNAQEDDLAEPANYEFSYEVQDPESGSEFSQEESRQDENAQGSYRVLLPDGRLQIVEYEADQEGYRPQIRYEDTGAGYPSGPQQRGSGGPY